MLTSTLSPTFSILEGCFCRLLQLISEEWIKPSIDLPFVSDHKSLVDLLINLGGVVTAETDGVKGESDEYHC